MNEWFWLEIYDLVLSKFFLLFMFCLLFLFMSEWGFGLMFMVLSFLLIFINVLFICSFFFFGFCQPQIWCGCTCFEIVAEMNES